MGVEEGARVGARLGVDGGKADAPGALFGWARVAGSGVDVVTVGVTLHPSKLLSKKNRVK